MLQKFKFKFKKIIFLDLCSGSMDVYTCIQMYNENYTIVMIPFSEKFTSINVVLDRPFPHDDLIAIKDSEKMQNQIVFKIVPYNDSVIRYRVVLFIFN